MNPKSREGLGEFVEKHIAKDTNPEQKHKQTADAAESYAAQEIINQEQKLAALYDTSVKDAMILAGKSMENEVGRKFYKALTRDKDAYIKTAIQRVVDGKRPLDEAREELDKLLKSAEEN